MQGQEQGAACCIPSWARSCARFAPIRLPSSCRVGQVWGEESGQTGSLPGWVQPHLCRDGPCNTSTVLQFGALSSEQAGIWLQVPQLESGSAGFKAVCFPVTPSGHQRWPCPFWRCCRSYSRLWACYTVSGQRCCLRAEPAFSAHKEEAVRIALCGY